MLSAMKMETAVSAPLSGIIKHVGVVKVQRGRRAGPRPRFYRPLHHDHPTLLCTPDMCGGWYTPPPPPAPGCIRAAPCWMSQLRKDLCRGMASIAPRCIWRAALLVLGCSQVFQGAIGGGQGDACEAGDLLVFMEEGEEPANHVKVRSPGTLAWPAPGLAGGRSAALLLSRCGTDGAARTTRFIRTLPVSWCMILSA